MRRAWERLVRTVKQCLKAILNGSAVREDVLTTALVEARNLINSRPLTYDQNDPNDLDIFLLIILVVTIKSLFQCCVLQFPQTLIAGNTRSRVSGSQSKYGSDIA